ncbi:hypothetical protein D3C86_1654600 [compost metagenome]
MGSLPSDRAANACTCALNPMGNGSSGVWISSPVITASVTASGTEAWKDASLRVPLASMFGSPTATPVATPFSPASLLTRALPSSLLRHCRPAALVTSRDWPSEKVAMATKV